MLAQRAWPYRRSTFSGPIEYWWNRSVGTTCSLADSDPRLWTLIAMRMSSGDALAYSTVAASKYRSSSNTTVSISSYSNSCACYGLFRQDRKGPEFRLRQLRAVLHERVRRRAIEMEVILLLVFAVIALTVG